MNQQHPAEGPGKQARGDDPLALQTRLRHGLEAVALSLLILMLMYVILRELAGIFRPLLIAGFLCYLFVPAHRWLVRHKVPSVLAYLLIAGIVLGTSYGVATMTYRSIERMSRDLPAYAGKLQAAREEAVATFKQKFSRLLHEVRPADTGSAGVPATAAASTGPASADPNPAGPTESAAPEPNESQYRLFSTDQLTALGRSGIEAFVGIFTSMFVVVVFMVFLLAEMAGMEKRVAGAFGTDKAEQILEVTRKINAAVTQYIAVKTFTSLLLAAATTVILALFGVQYAVLWGILTFFANFVPYIGSMVAVALPILMSYVQYGMLLPAVELLAILTVCQLAIGYAVEPKMIGRKLGVSPLMILLSLAFWGFLWGVPGMVLSAPLIVTVKIILENIEPTRPLAKLLSSG